MEGSSSDLGVLPQSIGYLLGNMSDHQKMKSSFFEIYNETLNDLLEGSKQECAKKVEIFSCQTSNGDTIQRAVNLKEVAICDLQEFSENLARANQRRNVSATDRNPNSSRSHAVIQITLTENDAITSNIMFLDLAGSESSNDHMDGTDKNTRLSEMSNINKSVTQLRNVIEGLKNNLTAVDFRSSKLTYLLKPSLTRKCKTLIITTMSQETKYLSSSKTSLALAQSAGQIKFETKKK